LRNNDESKKQLTKKTTQHTPQFEARATMKTTRNCVLQQQPIASRRKSFPSRATRVVSSCSARVSSSGRRACAQRTRKRTHLPHRARIPLNCSSTFVVGWCGRKWVCWSPPSLRAANSGAVRTPSHADGLNTTSPKDCTREGEKNHNGSSAASRRIARRRFSCVCLFLDVVWYFGAGGTHSRVTEIGFALKLKEESGQGGNK